MRLAPEEEARIREAVGTIEDEEAANVLKGETAVNPASWAEDLIVNAPNNQVVRPSEIVARMKQKTGLQYSRFERHREATLLRRDCVVTMGFEIVVPRGDVPNSGKTIHRRYTNIYYFEEGGWRVIARQATDISVEQAPDHP